MSQENKALLYFSAVPVFLISCISSECGKHHHSRLKKTWKLQKPSEASNKILFQCSVKKINK